jgi:hypothetical protein
MSSAVVFLRSQAVLEISSSPEVEAPLAVQLRDIPRLLFEKEQIEQAISVLGLLVSCNSGRGGVVLPEEMRS